MSDSPQYEAFREFARATIALEVVKASLPLHEEMRSLRTQLETRSAAPLTGDTGPAGKDGAPGKDGVDGKDGRDGKDGERGVQGERGADGLQGRDGTSGKDGKDGVPGERGAQGERGADGVHGRDGAVGERGERGADGVAGPPGERGERGADGLAGRDGAPSMVPGPRGEPGERGADGIATLAELDARIEARFADLQVRTFADVYQGVFEPDKLYTRGLLATWGGSLWLSLHETRAKPGENGDWKLIVKKGSDGRK